MDGQKNCGSTSLSRHTQYEWTILHHLENIHAVNKLQNYREGLITDGTIPIFHIIVRQQDKDGETT
jgi:hypothetical protein